MKKLEWTTVKRKVSDLVPQIDNYKSISENRKQKLIQSLEKFGLVDIPVIDRNNTVISGHQRLVCLIVMGKEDEIIDVRYPSRKLTKQELKEYTIIANKEFGEINFDKLSLYVEDIETSLLDDLDINYDNVIISIEKTTPDQVRESMNPASTHKQENIELKPFKEVLVLLSFPPEKLIFLSQSLEEIKKLEFVEYDQISI